MCPDLLVETFPVHTALYREHRRCGALQAQDTFETVPNSDLEVSRTASKDNLSHYYVNGKKSSAKEVTELLKSKGVDLENSRFLILQVCPVLHSQNWIRCADSVTPTCSLYRARWSRFPS